MAGGQHEFGISNLEYDLVITLGNLLQGVEVMKKYAKDAEDAGDDECARLFATMRDQDREWAQEVRAALGRHIAQAD